MTLNSSKLQSELENWMNNPYDNINDAANAFADAYDTYALDAVDVSGDSPLLLNKAGIVSAFLTLTTEETSTSSALKFETGLVSYWTGGTFNLTTPPAGSILPEISAIVTVPIIPPAISGTLTTIFTDTSSNVATKAVQIATLFDTVTKTIVVTCIGTNASPPPPTVTVLGPIT